MSNITRYVWGEHGMYKDTCGYYVDAKEYDRLTAQLADRDAEIKELKHDLSMAIIAEQTCVECSQEFNKMKQQLAERDAEIAELNQIAKIHSNRYVEKVVHLTKQLTASQQECSNYKNVLIGQGFENLDLLAKETRDTTQIGLVARQRVQELQQEVERLTIQRDFAQNELNDVITTRFEASKATAREIVEILDEEIQYVPKWKNAGKIEDEVITNIKQRYGLEG